jgi:excisionase family DNA binding protein
MLGVSRALAYRWIQDGTLPCLRIGHTVRVPVSALRDWINSSTRKAAVQPEAR